MARKAKKKAEKQPLTRWLKYLAPALLLPILVVGGLYAGAVLLGDSPSDAPEDAPSRTAEASQETEDDTVESRQETAPLPRPSQESKPLDLEQLRITDTLVRDGTNQGSGGYLPDNSSLPVEAQTTPEAVTAAKEATKKAESKPSDAALPTQDVATAEQVKPEELKDESPENKSPNEVTEKEVIPPLWLRNATAPKAVKGQPMIAVVIDDIGPNLRNARRTISLPAPLTLAFLPYANHLDDLTGKAREAGHELLVHMPMEPEEQSQNPGENALLTGLAPEELQRRLKWSLDRFSGYVGMNNHMGSKFTKSEAGMRLVMSELAKRGLLFLDSRTIAESRAEAAAKAFRLPFAQRDVFIDNDHRNRDAIRRQLAAVEALARRQGHAVAIGHPHDGTLEVLAEWLPMAVKRGFALVPISEIVRQNLQLARATPAPEPEKGRVEN